jgi:type IV secretory pathway VirB10-like protein
VTDIKNTESEKSTEKKADFDKKSKKFVLALVTLLVVGLVVSMFKTSHREPVANNSPTPDQSMPVTDFSLQMQFEQNQLNAAKMRNTSRTGGNLSSSNSKDDDSDWEAKERVRALDSRRASYALEDATKNSPNNNAAPGTYAAANYPLNNATTNDNIPGANIVGRSVDDSYPGQQQGDALLIPTGTVVDGILDRDAISDYTGPWEGHLTQDVYSIDHQFILLPKGTKIMGQSVHVTNVNEPIQNRMGLTVEWAVLPNGKRIDFHKNATIDQAGVPAFEGSVNYHFVAQFLAVAAYATISAAGPQDQVNQNGYIQPTFKGQFADGTRAALLPFVMKYLSLIPTVTLESGMPIKIHTQDDLYVKAWARVNTTVYTNNDSL